MSLFDEKPGIDTLTVVWDDPDTDPRIRTYNPDLMDPWLEKVQLELERLQALKGWAHGNYVTSKRSRQVQMLFDLVEGREGWRVCANCGTYTENYCIIEKGPPEENWIEDVWVKMGMLGKPICGECYYQ